MVERGNHNAEAPGLEPLRAWHPIEVLHFSLRSVAQLERKGARRLAPRCRASPPTLHQKLLADAPSVRVARTTSTTSFAVDDATLEHGLADGTLVVDTRLRDALRALRAPDGRFAPARTAGTAALAFRRPGVREDAALAAETALLEEIDGIVRATARVDALERRLPRLEREPFDRLRRLARR